MTPNPHTVWCVSDGRAGIERQTLAVANALSELVPVATKVVRLNPRAPQVWFPPTLWPAPLAALPKLERARLLPPWPDVWIANGRRSIPYSLRAKAWSGGKTFVVQLQNPRVNVGSFDLVAPPRHDRVRGNNVITTLGAPVWFTAKQIEAAKLQFPSRALIMKRKVLVILGGPSKRHQFNVAHAQRIIADLTLIAASDVHFMITTSRRTSSNVTALFRAFAEACGASFFATEVQDGANPYLAWLATADCALVTEDSTNLITDAAFFGLPVHLLKLDGGDARFDQLHSEFIEAGVARWFMGRLESWTYQPVRDAMLVAQAIAERLSAS